MTLCACGCGTEVAKTWARGHDKRTPTTGTPCQVEGCGRARVRNGMCHAHAEYVRRTGKVPTGPVPSRDPLVRFWAKVEKTDACWLWTGSTGGDGRYGSFGLNGKLVRAHRFSYELVHGPIPDGLDIDHLCRTTLCVRPDHLEAVTHRVNVMRGNAPSVANSRKTHCPRGHEYTEENTYRQRNGGRLCRTCMRVHAREAQRRYRARKKARAA